MFDVVSHAQATISVDTNILTYLTIAHLSEKGCAINRIREVMCLPSWLTESQVSSLNASCVQLRKVLPGRVVGPLVYHEYYSAPQVSICEL